MAEMGKIKELNAQKSQSVIDVLGQVSASSIQRSRVSICQRTAHQYVETGDVMNGF